MDENQFRQLLDKYVKGECTPEERNLLHQFYDSFQGESTQGTPESPDAHQLEKEIFKGVKQKISSHERQAYDLKISRKRKTYQFLKIAASVLIVIGLGIGSYQVYKNEPAPTIAMVEKSTQSGQRATIELMDGTKVYLNAESKLTFPEQFDPDKREVTLEGEAFFEVTPNKRRPFIIKAENVTTTVLGTSFNIKAFKGESPQVTVATGKVKVDAQYQDGKSGEVFLVPNQQAFFDGQLNKREVDISQYLAWRDKIIHFDEVTLAEAAKVLERWYGVTITIKDEPIRHCTISGHYIDENLLNIMESLEYILGIEYRFEQGREIIIEGKECKSRK